MQADMWDSFTPNTQSLSQITTLLGPSFTGLVTSMDKSAWFLLENSGFSEEKSLSTFLSDMSPNTRLPCTKFEDLTGTLCLPTVMWNSNTNQLGFTSISSNTMAECY